MMAMMMMVATMMVMMPPTVMVMTIIADICAGSPRMSAMIPAHPVDVRFTPESCRDRRPIATAEKGQKLPSSLGYSITSSAMARSVGGTVRPKVLAVLRLITNSNLVGACTGRSAGFSPLRMRST